MTAPFDPEAHVDHMSAVLDLEIAPEWRPGVVASLAATAAAAALVIDFALGDDVAPAPVFRA
jgi:hypothetical protein